MTFQEKLDVIIQKNRSLVCIGLDSDIDRIPAFFKSESDAQYLFNKAIINATHDLVCAYKPNSAYYEANGSEGIRALKMTCDYIRKQHPEIPIILDAKRADIGTTNEGYVHYAFDYLKADAITLHPYLGYEAIEPFLHHADKGCIILCKTSNPGAAEFQDLTINNEPLYQIVARKVSKEWNNNNNCMLVVGATYPQELAKVREIVGDMTLLVPGIGAQGGDVEKTLKAGLNSRGQGMIINSSRTILFASNGKDFAKKAREETMKLRETINNYRRKEGGR